MAELDKSLQSYWKHFQGKNDVSRVLAGEGFYAEK
jgi:hypothetical protein